MREVVYRRVSEFGEFEIHMVNENNKDVYVIVADKKAYSQHDSIWDAKKIIDELAEGR